MPVPIRQEGVFLLLINANCPSASWQGGQQDISIMPLVSPLGQYLNRDYFVEYCNYYRKEMPFRQV
jgi:hypothetical protein